MAAYCNHIALNLDNIFDDEACMFNANGGLAVFSIIMPLLVLNISLFCRSSSGQHHTGGQGRC